MFAAEAAVKPTLFLGDDHRLDRRGHVVDDLDDDHVRADVLDRLGQVDVAFVDLQPARFFDRGGDVLSRDRPTEASRCTVSARALSGGALAGRR